MLMIPRYILRSLLMVKNLNTTRNRLQSCVFDIDRWMAINKLKLNKDKTELILLHPRFRNSLTLNCLTLGNETIVPVTKARNIGVIFDSTMSLESHANSIVKCAFFHSRSIAIVMKFLSYDTSKTQVHSLACSKIDNCVIIWTTKVLN